MAHVFSEDFKFLYHYYIISAKHCEPGSVRTGQRPTNHREFAIQGSQRTQERTNRQKTQMSSCSSMASLLVTPPTATLQLKVILSFPAVSCSLQAPIFRFNFLNVIILFCFSYFGSVHLLIAGRSHEGQPCNYEPIIKN